MQPESVGTSARAVGAEGIKLTRLLSDDFLLPKRAETKAVSTRKNAYTASLENFFIVVAIGKVKEKLLIFSSLINSIPYFDQKIESFYLLSRGGI